MFKISDIFRASLILIFYCGILRIDNGEAAKMITNSRRTRYNEANKTRGAYKIIDPNSLTTGDDVTIQLVINIDKPLFNYYSGRSQKAMPLLRNLVHSSIEDVKRSFQHPSLGRKINIDLQGIRFLRNNTNLVNMSENGSEYLRSYCEWQATLKQRRNKVWFSVLLSGLDLYYVNAAGRRVWLSEGRGYRNGVCHVHKSCTLIEGTSKSLVHVLTHELGHSLGILHDGPPENSCSPSGYIMSKSFDRKTLLDNWSTCSRDRLRKFLTTKKAHCLRNH